MAARVPAAHRTPVLVLLLLCTAACADRSQPSAADDVVPASAAPVAGATVSTGAPVTAAPVTTSPMTTSPTTTSPTTTSPTTTSPTITAPISSVRYQFTLVPGLDPLGMVELLPPQRWRPDPDAPLDIAIPRPWPADVAALDVPFKPYHYRINAAMLCGAARSRPAEATAIARIGEQLFDRMIASSVVVDGARFVESRHTYQYEDIILEPPWVSAVGNAGAVLGTLALARCWPSTRYDAAVDELVRAFGRTEDDGGPWFRRELANGVWYEEYPVADRPVQVLNGHLAAIIALYYVWDTGGHDETVRAWIDGALVAALEHLPQYRRAGDVLCYDLTPPCHADYGPLRTVNQLDDIATISRGMGFAAWRDTFATDAGIVVASAP